MKTPLVALLSLFATAMPGFAQEPCTVKPKPCTPEQKRAWDREVAANDARQMNALFAFVKSLDPVRRARFNAPLVDAGSHGATGRGFRVSDLDDAQKAVFVRMLRALPLDSAESKQIPWTGAVADKQLGAVHVRFCAVVLVEDKTARSDSGIISLFDYGSGAAMPYPAAKPAGIAGRERRQKPARAEYLRRATALMKRTAFPPDAPIAESAFVREVTAPWKNLSAPQQEWVKKSVTASMNLGANFRWERATVRMWRSVTFTGGYKASDSPSESSGFSNSYL